MSDDYKREACEACEKLRQCEGLRGKDVFCHECPENWTCLTTSELGRDDCEYIRDLWRKTLGTVRADTGEGVAEIVQLSTTCPLARNLLQINLRDNGPGLGVALDSKIFKHIYLEFANGDRGNFTKCVRCGTYKARVGFVPRHGKYLHVFVCEFCGLDDCIEIP
jgi:hypothetical protein